MLGQVGPQEIRMFRVGGMPLHFVVNGSNDAQANFRSRQYPASGSA
jgi:hypothetical protein